MDYTNLFAGTGGKKSKVGIIGATRGYGYTLLAQILHVDLMELRAVCSRHPEECLAVLKEIGYDENKIVVCKDEEEIKKAPEDAIIIVADYRMVMAVSYTHLDVYKRQRPERTLETGTRNGFVFYRGAEDRQAEHYGRRSRLYDRFGKKIIVRQWFPWYQAASVRI